MRPGLSEVVDIMHLRSLRLRNLVSKPVLGFSKIAWLLEKIPECDAKHFTFADQGMIAHVKPHSLFQNWIESESTPVGQIRLMEHHGVLDVYTNRNQHHQTKNAINVKSHMVNHAESFLSWAFGVFPRLYLG